MFDIPRQLIRPMVIKSLAEVKHSKAKLMDKTDNILFIEENGEITSIIDLSFITESKNQTIDLTTQTHSIKQVPQINLNQVDNNILVTILLHQIVLISDNDQLIGYLKSDDLYKLFLTVDGKYFDLFKTVAELMPHGVMITGRDKTFIYCNEVGLNLMSMDKKEVIGRDVTDTFSSELIEDILFKKEKEINHICQFNGVDVLASFNPVIGMNNNVEAIVILFHSLQSLEGTVYNTQYVEDLKIDLNAVLATYEEILVVNEKGTILRFSENYIPNFWWTDNPHELIGGNILQFEKEGKISPSVTRLVLEKEKQVSILQQNRTGKSVMAVGIPVFNERGDIHRIVIHSKDVTETVELKSELNQMKKLTNEYKSQLDLLKNEPQSEQKFVYSSTKMEQVMESIKKVAQFDSTIMINGESGVGKELIARSIYEHSRRSNEQFLAVNCGAIPGSLLESELFGYVPGAFTGASKEGKVGFFEKADKGILFLDEISELPQELQVKLLRVLQEREVTPIGGTEPIPVDVQIISATNKDLANLVAKNQFREDLYYRINVIPVNVPPLRERIEDISPLAYYFITELNNKYDKNYHLAPEALRLLEIYSWPGNVRELQNIIERFVVFADEDLITADFIRPFLNFGSNKEGDVIVTDLIPLNEAQNLMESQLISLALDRYKTATQAAKALGISQSTFSRKHQRLLDQSEK